ncbi:MAG: hypothetical protein FWD76_00200 [Firmicutes bacterium]|nr:hypothetical protein [Bacillota bacterium]
MDKNKINHREQSGYTKSQSGVEGHHTPHREGHPYAPHHEKYTWGAGHSSFAHIKSPLGDTEPGVECKRAKKMPHMDTHDEPMEYTKTVEIEQVEILESEQESQNQADQVGHAPKHAKEYAEVSTMHHDKIDLKSMLIACVSIVLTASIFFGVVLLANRNNPVPGADNPITDTLPEVKPPIISQFAVDGKSEVIIGVPEQYEIWSYAPIVEHIVWDTDNHDIAFIDKVGKLTPKQEGKVLVSAKIGQAIASMVVTCKW